MLTSRVPIREMFVEAFGPLRVIIASGVFASAVLTVGLGWAAQQAVERHVIEARIATAVSVANQLFEAGHVPLSPADGATLEHIDGAVRWLLLGGDTVRVKVWNPEGVITYSDQLALIGRRFGLSAAARSAMSGETVFARTALDGAAHEFERHFGELYKLFVPIFAQDGEVVALFEVYKDPQALDRALGRIARRVWWTSGLGVLSLGGLMLTLTIARTREVRLRAAVEEQQQVATRLRALDAMKDNFLQAVSHELRTPLTSILGAATTLRRQREQLDSTTEERLFDALDRNAQRLTRLLTDLLDIGRLLRNPDDATLAPAHLPDVVRRVVEQINDDAHAVEMSIEPLTIRTHGPSLERVLDNLLRNAVRHTPPGSTVRVTVRGQPAGVSIVVDDDGPGIPEEVRSRLFEPFVQGRASSHDPRPGTGIGLALVERLVTRLGGTVEAGNSPMGGARFTVVLPNDLLPPPNRTSV